MSENVRQNYNGGLTLMGSLEPIATGDTFKDWPLHVTVLPRFNGTKGSKAEIDAAIQQQVDLYHHLDIVGTRLAMLGAEHDVPACVVESEGLITLHNDLLDSLRLYLPAGYFDNEYVGDGYLPHASDTVNNYFEVGDAKVLNSLYLVARNRDPKGGHIKTVVKQYPFKALQ